MIADGANIMDDPELWGVLEMKRAAGNRRIWMREKERASLQTRNDRKETETLTTDKEGFRCVIFVAVLPQQRRTNRDRG
jgi:hypothetical protein